MKKTLSLAAFLSISALPALLVGCKSKPAPAAPSAAETREVSSIFAGLWEGKDKKGDIYTFSFTSMDWESHVDKGGAVQPYCKGTYTHTGSSLILRVTHEVNLKTMNWKPETGNFPPNISGRLEGGRLKISVLTDAALAKRR
jgi:hypothetical protein